MCVKQMEGKQGWRKKREEASKKGLMDMAHPSNPSTVEPEVLWEPRAFKIPAHLGVVSYTINAAVKRVFALLLPALTSGC